MIKSVISLREIDKHLGVILLAKKSDFALPIVARNTTIDSCCYMIIAWYLGWVWPDS